MITTKEAYNETNGFEELKAHIFAFLERYAVRQVMDRLDTRGVADAKDILEEAFQDLDEKFARQEKIETINTSPR
jgi:hypothetical protein